MKIIKKPLSLLKRFLKAFFSMRWLAYFVTLFIPINKKKIVIDVDNGSGYKDNPRYIIEEILKENIDCKLYWVVKNKEIAKDLPDTIIPVKYGTFSAVFHLLTACVWIDNSRKIVAKKRRKTLYIQTWHGGSAYKKVEKASESVLPKSYVKIAKHDSKMISLFLSDAKVKTDLIYRDFWYQGYVYETCAPRSYYLEEANKNPKLRNEIKEKVYEYFGIPKNKKIILYAPTFRADYSIDAYDVDCKRVLSACNESFKGDFVLLIRLHGNVADKANCFKYDNETLFNATPYVDTQNLLLATDVLITDYSSILFDYSVLNKPIFRYANDIELYVGDRGFYFDVNTYPFPLATNNDELEKIILNFDLKLYLKRLDEYNKKTGVINDQETLSNICKIIKDYLKHLSIKKLADDFNFISYSTWHKSVLK